MYRDFQKWEFLKKESCAELCSLSSRVQQKTLMTIFPLRLIFFKIIKLYWTWKHFLNRHFPKREFRKIVLSLLLCSPSTTYHNFPFFEILIFEIFCLCFGSLVFRKLFEFWNSRLFQKFKNSKFLNSKLLWKKIHILSPAAGIRAQVFRLPVECSELL